MARPTNRRADSPRERMRVTCAITWEGRHQVCLMEDRSPKGALLRVNADLPLPRRFSLEMTPGRTVPVRAVWRTKEHVGVRIDDGGAGALDGLRQLRRRLAEAFF